MRQAADSWGEVAGESNGPIEYVRVSIRKPVRRGCTFYLESRDEGRIQHRGAIKIGEASYLEPESTFAFLENTTEDLFLFGTGFNVRRKPADIIVFRSVVLVQYLNLELCVTGHVLDPPELVPYGL